MKKLLSISLFIIFLFASCDTAPEDVPGYVGNWILEEAIPVQGDSKIELEMNADETFEVVISDYDEEETIYELNMKQRGIFSVDGNTMTVWINQFYALLDLGAGENWYWIEGDEPIDIRVFEYTLGTDTLTLETISSTANPGDTGSIQIFTRVE